MPATRGTNFDSTGLKWCVSQTWHRGNPETALELALDEVPQTAAGCPSLSTEQVEFAAYGLTTDASCTQPCRSLYVELTIEVTSLNCDFIAARLFDYGTVNTNPTKGNFRGKQRMLHASGPPPFAYSFPLYVTSGP